MATYIKGVTGYVPQIQTFKPDLNFYNGALQMKQGSYDRAHKRLSSMYGSLLNSPMLREKNIKKRDQFFKTIEQDIQKLSGKDLSLKQNEIAGKNLFSQLTKDKEIVKDMTWTRNWQKEQQRAENFRNCFDEEKCGGSWWEGGVKALQYKAQEFKNATDEQAMSMDNARFTPYQDVMKKAMKLADDAGLSVKVDRKQGGYIVTEKNGKPLIKPLTELFMGSLSKDPAVMEYYKTKAYTDRKDWIQANAPQYGSLEEAEVAYYNNVTGQLSQNFGKQRDKVAFEKESLENQRNNLEQRIRNEGTTPDGNLAQQYRRLNDIEQGYANTKEVVDENENRTRSIRQSGFSTANMQNLDQAVAAYSLGSDLGQAAQTLAFKDYEFTMETDPYSLEGFKQANRMALENRRAYNDLLVEKYKFDLDQVAEVNKAKGSIDSNKPTFIDVVSGNIDVNDMSEDAAIEMLNERKSKLKTELSQGERQITGKFFKTTKLQSEQENGRGAASEDMIDMAEAVLDATVSSKSKSFTTANGEVQRVDSETRSMARRQRQAFEEMSYDEKLEYAQGKGMQKMVGTLPGYVLDNVYNNVVAKKIDMTDDYNQANKPYLNSLWGTTRGLQNQIDKKNKALADLNEWQKEDAFEVIQTAKSGVDIDAEKGQMFEFLVDEETGHIRKDSDFARDYARNVVSNLPEYRTQEASSYLRSGMDIKADMRTGMNDRTVRVKVDKDAEYDKAYQEAIRMYHGKDTEAISPQARQVMATADKGLGVMAEFANWAFSDSEESIVDEWKTYYSQNMNPKGHLTDITLTGQDAVITRGINHPAIDPQEYMSEGYQNTTSFLRDALDGQGQEVKVNVGGFGEIPEVDSENGRTILRQLYQDATRMQNDKYKDRPVMDVTYTDIAGGDREWTGMNVKLNEQYVREHLGSEDNPGLLAENYQQLRDEGMTVYLRKDAAKNGFRKAVDKSALESAFYYTGQHSFDEHPQISKDITLKSAPGGYEITGNVVTGVNNETGETQTKPIVVPYDSTSDLSKIINDWNQTLQMAAQNFKQVRAKLGTEGLITDPQQLVPQ